MTEQSGWPVPGYSPYPPLVPGEEPPRRNRTGQLIAMVAGILIGLLILTVAVVVAVNRTLAAPATLDDVAVYEDLDYDHVPGGVDYPQSPPVGGPHADTWWACGVYDEPVREENVVHSLEHGTTWITWRDLDRDEVERLAAVLPDNGILSPYPDQDAPVVVTVWGRQLELRGPDDRRLELFIRKYGDGHTSREPMVGCAGGTTDPTGGSGLLA